MAEITITINQDVLEQARNTFSAMTQQVDQEIGRQSNLFQRFNPAMGRVRDVLARSQHMASSEHLWYDSGMDGIAHDSLDGRHSIEHMRSVATATSRQLIFAHPGPVGNALQSYVDHIDQAFGRALSEYWNITDGFFPGNTIALSSYSSTIDGNFSQLDYWLKQLQGALEEIIRLIDSLLKGESLFIAELTAGPANGLVFPTPGETPQTGHATDSIFSPENNNMSVSTTAYLQARYGWSFEGGLKQEGKKDPTLGAGVDYSGDLGGAAVSENGKFLGIPFRHTDGVKLAALSVSGGLEASLDPKAKHWAKAGVFGEFAAVEGYDETVIGSKQFGYTDETTTKALAGEGFAGFEDGNLGAHVGVDLVSVERQVGVNVAGVNVGLDGEIGLKAELGFQIGKKTEVKLPFISFGFAIGGAK
ncbi:MAG TPA: hypothetical protein VGF38_06610 [Ktedonobacterales bacterium]|jgi:hypothetical protein